jgi:hypothetical protein
MRHLLAATVLAALIHPSVAANDQKPLASGFSPAIRVALITGMVYSFAVTRNGDGYCLPPNDEGLDIVWKAIDEDRELFKDVQVQPNRLPETAYLQLLRRLFPCR